MFCILRGGEDRLIKDAAGKEWIFEDHPYCGPSVLDKNGDPASKQPGSNSPFWKAVRQWIEQGKNVKDGICVYEHREEKNPILKHMGGRHYEIIGWE